MQLQNAEALRILGDNEKAAEARKEPFSAAPYS
jgi:hypothetical protein